MKPCAPVVADLSAYLIAFHGLAAVALELVLGQALRDLLDDAGEIQQAGGAELYPAAVQGPDQRVLRQQTPGCDLIQELIEPVESFSFG